jgi:hypothetical protein
VRRQPTPLRDLRSSVSSAHLSLEQVGLIEIVFALSASSFASLACAYDARAIALY